MFRYYVPQMGNFLIPEDVFGTPDVMQEAVNFLKANTGYMLVYCSISDGYENGFWAVTPMGN